MRRLVQENGQGRTIGDTAMGVTISSRVQISVDTGGDALGKQWRIGEEGEWEWEWVPQEFMYQEGKNVTDAGFL